MSAPIHSSGGCFGANRAAFTALWSAAAVLLLISQTHAADYTAECASFAADSADYEGGNAAGHHGCCDVGLCDGACCDAPCRDSSCCDSLCCDSQPCGNECASGCCDCTDYGDWYSRLCQWYLPQSSLWESPLANQRAPRMFIKFTDLEGAIDSNSDMIDTAIGARLAAIRFAGCDTCGTGLQLELNAAVFSRFEDWNSLLTNDYLIEIPFTWTDGVWQAKLGYAHLSSHLGDEFIEATGRRRLSFARDEIVLGVARYIDCNWRVYGQFAQSFREIEAADDTPTRFNCGIEWTRAGATSPYGGPFAALDVDLRSEQDYEANVTAQFGWQWWVCNHTRSLRIALEVYDGKSPYGQFFNQDEDWVGFAALYDW